MNDPEALFALVTPPPPLPELKERRFGAVDVKWTEWRGARRPCDDCVQRVHEHGVQGAPLPFPATWRRKGPVSDLFLCAVDADERKRLDKAAEGQRDLHREHVEKARRSR